MKMKNKNKIPIPDEIIWILILCVMFTIIWIASDLLFSYILHAETCLDLCRKECVGDWQVFIYQYDDKNFHAVLYQPILNEYYDVAFNKRGKGKPCNMGLLLPCNSLYLKGGDR